jgi:hypothetical protein
VRISAGILGLLGLVGMSIGCGKSPSGPTPLVALNEKPVSPTVEFTVAAISPARGLAGDAVRLAGTGFLPGATLTLDGVAARVTGVNSTVIVATTPVHAAGTVDVVVTNAGGQSWVLTGGYTYEGVSLTTDVNRVTSEGPLSVSWVAPGGRPRGDWIALLKVGASSTSYVNGWWDYTNGAASGTFALSAPTQPGEYEFRYLVDDGFTDVARTSAVTVSASVSPLALVVRAGSK